ncbi:MAG TPA: TraB/GumN family protein [Allosphingosinicella sp.]|jgi:hypothetical protein
MRLGGWRSVRDWAKALAGAALLLLVPERVLADAPAPAPASAAAATPRPAIWLLEDEDTKIYLFGTTHIFPRGLSWRSPQLEAAIREADELVTEIPADEKVDEERLASGMFMGKSVPILSRVSPAHRERLEQLIEASGLPADAWDMMHSWAAGMLLYEMFMARAGDEAELSGAEIELRDEFRRAGKAMSAVETGEFQLGIFRSLSLPAQRAFLESTIDDLTAPPAPDATADDGTREWTSGNVEALAREMEALQPELYEALLTRRNRNWTEWLERRLERPGTVLFAVGAGHLAGRDSVQAMLAARGLEARRID